MLHLELVSQISSDVWRLSFGILCSLPLGSNWKAILDARLDRIKLSKIREGV